LDLNCVVANQPGVRLRFDIHNQIFFIVITLVSGISLAGEGFGTVEIEYVGGYDKLVFFYTTDHTNRPPCNGYKGGGG